MELINGFIKNKIIVPRVIISDYFFTFSWVEDD